MAETENGPFLYSDPGAVAAQNVNFLFDRLYFKYKKFKEKRKRKREKKEVV